MFGLSTAEATERLARVGPNAVPEGAPEPLWRRFVRQFQSPLIYILLFALGFDLGLWFYEGGHGWPIEASAIALILSFNAALGLYQEQRSEAALSRLKALAGAQAWVLRDGQLVRLASHVLVPGDAVRLEAGDRVPADGTLLDARGAMLDESILTGESIAVDKTALRRVLVTGSGLRTSESRCLWPERRPGQRLLTHTGVMTVTSGGPASSGVTSVTYAA